MANSSRNNHITIAKALGIILMVVGHSGCPIALGKFIYLFHMPLFFVCSGYFFKEITSRTSLISFYKKRINGLYIPFIKWSLLFLLLHDLFRYMNITVGEYYQAQDYIRQFVRVLTMTDYELLIRPFWFIKELFFVSLTVASISMIRTIIFPKVGTLLLLLISLIFAIVMKFVPPVPLIGDCSLLFLGTSYFYSGILIQKYKDTIPFKTSTMIISFISVLIGSVLFTGIIDMRFTTLEIIVPYFILSLLGVLMVFCISKKAENYYINSTFYYIGNHTMPILALNLLALKIGNLIKIWIYSLPMRSLSSYTVIYDYNSYFWVLYAIIGITIPLLVNYLYNKLVLHQ